MNAFGERQHVEKFIPKVMRQVLAGETVYIHSYPDKVTSGTRFYIHSRNIAHGVLFLIQHGKVGESYNLTGEKEVSNLELAKLIAETMGKEIKYEMVDFHSSRPGHDLRYGLDGSKMFSLGWVPPVGFESSMRKTILWTLENSSTSAKFKNSKIIRGGAVAILLSVTLAMLWMRPKIWWMQHWYDYYQFENWSSGLAHFGTSGVSGLNYEFKYHWFSFAWNGLLARLSNTQPWVATTRASLLISAVGIQLFFIAIVEFYGHRGIRARILLRAARAPADSARLRRSRKNVRAASAGAVDTR